MRSAFEMMLFTIEKLKELEADETRGKQETVDAVRALLYTTTTALLTHPLHETMAAPFQPSSGAASSAAAAGATACG